MKIVDMVMELFPGLIEEVMDGNVSTTYFCDKGITEGKIYISYHGSKLFKIKSVYNPVRSENGQDVMAYVNMFLYTKEEYGKNYVKISYLSDSEYLMPDASSARLYEHQTKMDWKKIIEEVYTTYDGVGILRRHTIENIIKSQ